MTRTPRILLSFAAIALLVVVVGTLLVGGLIARPANHRAAKPPSDLPVEPVSIPSASGSLLSGWFIPGTPHAGAVLLFHGVRDDRASMLPRARFLAQAGYAVLMIDFQAHGASPGSHITFGYLEARDVAAAAAYMHDRLPGESLGAVGVSLGGAAVTLSRRPLLFSAVSLESVYPDIESALRGRLVSYLGPPGGWLTPLLVAQLRPRLGIEPRDLTPSDHLADLSLPVLFMSGTADRYPTQAQTQAMFALLPGPKELWEVPGAKHVDLCDFAPAAYREHLLRFFGKYLRGRG
jgi:fermentation-respiration switch protein FrsA (DUF1100 family)